MEGSEVLIPWGPITRALPTHRPFPMLLPDPHLPSLGPRQCGERWGPPHDMAEKPVPLRLECIALSPRHIKIQPGWGCREGHLWPESVEGVGVRGWVEGAGVLRLPGDSGAACLQPAPGAPAVNLAISTCGKPSNQCHRPLQPSCALHGRMRTSGVPRTRPQAEESLLRHSQDCR